jgi:hypothetical protein
VVAGPGGRAGTCSGRALPPVVGVGSDTTACDWSV